MCGLFRYLTGVETQMPKPTWARHGESLDRMRAELSRPAPPKPVAKRNRKAEGEARARKLLQERDDETYEAEFNERIKTIGAEIRADNLQRMLDRDFTADTAGECDNGRSERTV
jgi:hypothetical protein